ncbi:MAG TPA: DUF929 family protein [Acidimicrobiales bacterium]|nr:DUF929 family protein [Acidimicrobiales bacterium]
MASGKQGSGGGDPGPGGGKGRGSGKDGGNVPPRPGTRPSGGGRPKPSGRPAGSGARPGQRPAPRSSARQVAQRRRQRNIYIAGGSAGAVVLIVVVIVGVVLGSGGGGTPKTSTKDSDTFALTGLVTQDDLAKVENVPVKDLAAAALSADMSNTKIEAEPPQKLPSNNPPLVQGGKPEFLYMGGEYCPYCANERWALVMAFSKFGTFSNLKGTTSSVTDTLPNTPTFSFYGSSYSSKYISFVPVELYTNSGQNQSTGAYPTLQAPTAQQLALMTKYDAPPYVPSSEDSGGIPFVYMAGRYVFIGPQFVSQALSAIPWDTAAALVTAGNNSTSQDAEASAGFLVADICQITKGQPGSVCSQVPKLLWGISTSTPKIKVSSKAPATTTTTAAKTTTTKAK